LSSLLGGSNIRLTLVVKCQRSKVDFNLNYNHRQVNRGVIPKK
jgi:hypothetical protein